MPYRAPLPIDLRGSFQVAVYITEPLAPARIAHVSVGTRRPLYKTIDILGCCMQTFRENFRKAGMCLRKTRGIGLAGRKIAHVLYFQCSSPEKNRKGQP